MKRLPELDALRAIAAVIVLLFHLDPLRYFPGWSGVDLFFVLSGFLISGIILENGGTTRFFQAFYVRRTLRIWPIYYLAVLGLLAVNPWLKTPSPLSSLPYVLTFTQNTSLYFKKLPPPIHPALDHTWTLAIEEQFYLVWPALVVWAGRKRFVPICLITISLALCCRGRDNGIFPSLNDRLLLARCDSFALGGLLAYFLGPGGWAQTHRVGAIRSLAGVVALGVLYFVWGCTSQGALGFIGLPTPSDPVLTVFAFGALYAGIIGLCSLLSGSRWLAPLRLFPLLYLGKISYGLYLYHYIVYWVIDGCKPDQHALTYAQPWTTQLFKLSTTVVVATASWFLVEQPILRWKDRFVYRSTNARPETPTIT